jgi:hypothetical protein
VLLWIENPGPTIHGDTSVGGLPFAIDKGQKYLGFTVVALELDGLYEHLDAGDSEHGAPQTDKLVDQMGLDLGKRVQLVEAEESDYDEALILVVTKHVQSHIVQGKGHRPGDVCWMVLNELQELLDIGSALLVEEFVVDVDHNLLKIVVFLLPLEQSVGLIAIVLAEELEEDQHCQVLEVALIKLLGIFMGEVSLPLFE